MYQYKKISLSEKTLKAVEKYQKKYKVDSIAQCLRKLIEIGLKTKEILPKNDEIMAQKNDFYQPSDQISRELVEILAVKKLLIQNLNWTVESRLLNRYSVANIPNQSKATSIEILQEIKERAQNFISKMVPGHVSVLSDTHQK